MLFIIFELNYLNNSSLNIHIRLPECKFFEYKFKKYFKAHFSNLKLLNVM